MARSSGSASVAWPGATRHMSPKLERLVAKVSEVTGLSAGGFLFPMATGGRGRGVGGEGFHGFADDGSFLLGLEATWRCPHARGKRKLCPWSDTCQGHLEKKQGN